MIRPISALLPDSAVRDRLFELSATRANAALRDIAHRYGTSGYIVESVPFAILAAERLSKLGFRGVVEEVIKAGGDTDSIASITGQICGTCVGQQALPKDWLARLPEGEHIMATLDSFFRHLASC